MERTISGLLLPAGRRVPGDNLHITLAFLGTLKPEQRHSAEKVADRVAIREFTLMLDTLGFWQRPRVAWLGTQKVPSALLQLEADLRFGLMAAGLAVDPRPYFPHMTVLRKAHGKGTPSVAHPPVQWRVREFVLLASRSAKAGVRYEMVQCWQNSAHS